MSILVTGGAGRLGTIVVETLVGQGFSVKVFDIPQANFEQFSKYNDAQVSILKGDIADYAQVEGALKGVDSVIHLASLLPPKSEEGRDLTMRINVEGTQNIVRVLSESGSNIPLVFSSSVSVYGKTFKEKPTISEDHTLVSLDIYSESKILAENVVKESTIPYVILRIAGVVLPQPVELPDILPFKADQRVEFVSIEDVARIIANAVRIKECHQVFNIAGGESWQVTGEEFVQKLYQAMHSRYGGEYSPDYGWVDWYDTQKAREVLNFSPVDFDDFLWKLEVKSRDPNTPRYQIAIT